MMPTVFGICLIISVAVFIYMAQKNYNNIDIYYWTLVVLIPVTLMGYWLKTMVTTVEGAMYLFCFIYIDSTFMLVVLLFAMLHTLGIQTKSWLKILGYGIATVHMAMVCLSVHSDLYYESMTIIDKGIGMATKMTPGPLKFFHMVYIVAVILLLSAIIVVSFLKKGTYSRRTLGIYACLISAGIVIYIAEYIVGFDFSLLPFLYVVGDLVIAADYDYAHTHDISCLISEQQKHHGTRGYVAIGLERQFLSCNDKSLEFFPNLKNQRVDALIPPGEGSNTFIHGIIDRFEEMGKTSEKFKVGELTCVCDISYFSIRKDGRKQGYLLDIRDATEEQRNHDIIASYNRTLSAEIEEKTADIREMQRKIVLGMANMIENRDDNTGGHVKRTSDVIEIIADEIRKQHTYHLSEDKVGFIVRAASTHDLGKIVIDSSILKKPGRLTDDEYAIMKSHAAKSGEMVHILLDGIEDPAYVEVAFNMARHHHERWDGKGYPDGLVGNLIPVEARIMAVADVYDALVSERCYKKPYSFETACQIMCENMGTQFDPNLKTVFLGCREKLEAYYSQQSSANFT